MTSSLDSIPTIGKLTKIEEFPKEMTNIWQKSKTLTYYGVSKFLK